MTDLQKNVGFAQWKKVSTNDGKKVNLIHQQEVVLSKQFVEENFKPDVLKYVRKATLSVVIQNLFKYQRLTVSLIHDL
jgi:hypothetical protein